MKKEIKGIISLAVAVVVVAAMVGLLFWQRNREVPEEYVPVAPPQVVRLVERREDEIVKVVFQDEDGTRTLLPFIDEDGRTQWMWEGVEYVLHLPYARNKARAGFSIFSSQVIHENVREVPDLRLEDFGFSQVIMTAHYDDGTSLSLYMGGPTPDFSGYFVMVEGDPGLYVITRANGDRLLLGLDDLLCRMLPIWDAETIDYVLINEQGRDPIEFIRVDHEEIEGMTLLRMLYPMPDRDVHASGFEFHVLEDFSSFMFSGVVSVHPTDLRPYGLDDPGLEFIYEAFHGQAHLLFGDVFFRDVNGEETAFIYVKFADRPHVFEALYEPVRALQDVNFLRFVERFIYLVNIQSVERINIVSQDGEIEIYINQVEDSNDIAPTVNGEAIADQPFRVAYRLLVGLGIDGEIEPFTPRTAPVHTVTYTHFEYDDVELRFYVYDENFFAVSVDGEEIWFVTSRLSFDRFLAHLAGIQRIG